MLKVFRTVDKIKIKDSYFSFSTDLIYDFENSFNFDGEPVFTILFANGLCLRVIDSSRRKFNDPYGYVIYEGSDPYSKQLSQKDFYFDQSEIWGEQYLINVIQSVALKHFRFTETPKHLFPKTSQLIANYLK